MKCLTCRNNIKGYGLKFCSHKCYISSKDHDSNYITCEVCGIKKRYNPYRIKNLNPRFCSNKCKGIGLNTKDYLYKKCKSCERMFYYPPYKQKRGTRFCSRSCAGKYSIVNLGERMKGRSHSPESKKKIAAAHLGGFKKRKNTSYKLNAIKLFRERSEYIIWRNGVFRRDSFTCQTCHKWGGELNAHHIVPLSSIVNFLSGYYSGDDLFFKLVKFPMAVDISNGSTLCRECHKKTDSFLRHIDHKKYYKRIVDYLCQREDIPIETKRDSNIRAMINYLKI